MRRPDADSYRDLPGRAAADAALREHVAASIESLRARIATLTALADEEGEQDMQFDLARIDERMGRTAEALRSADYSGVAFFDRPEIPEAELASVCAYDGELLDDLDLLVTDVSGLKYETIGNLTLREVEGTLAGIELKVINRRDILQQVGRT